MEDITLAVLAICAGIQQAAHFRLKRRFNEALQIIEDAFETQRSFNSSQMDINSHHAVLLASLIGPRSTNVLNLAPYKKKETDA